MTPRELLQVDPAALRLPGSRRDGADPLKLRRQFARYGSSLDGMPPPEVKRGTDGELVLYDGVTRAARGEVSAWNLDHSRGDRKTEGGGRWIADHGRIAMKTSEQTRLDLLAALAELGRMRPQWRLGQTLANVAMTAGRMEASGVWDLEDEEALAAAKTLIEHDAEVERGVA